MPDSRWFGVALLLSLTMTACARSTEDRPASTTPGPTVSPGADWVEEKG